MAHAPIFDVVVDEWGPREKPRAVTVTCRTCAGTFAAAQGATAGPRTFAIYLGAIHLHCPKCEAEGPVHFRQLGARRRR